MDSLKQAIPQTTSTEFLSLTPISATVVGSNTTILRTTDGGKPLDPSRSIQSLLTSTMLCLLMQIRERLSARWGIFLQDDERRN